MSEYLDAISRLEAPERPPMVKYIQKIPFMEYPQHDSEKDWNRINSQLVLFGRYHCKSKNPKCESCKLKEICKEKIPNK